MLECEETGASHRVAVAASPAVLVAHPTPRPDIRAVGWSSYLQKPARVPKSCWLLPGAVCTRGKIRRCPAAVWPIAKRPFALAAETARTFCPPASCSANQFALVLRLVSDALKCAGLSNRRRQCRLRVDYLFGGAKEATSRSIDPLTAEFEGSGATEARRRDR